MIKWHLVYREIAQLLLKFWSDHKNYPGVNLYRLLSNDIQFPKNNRWLENLHENYKLESLDPIQLFLSFSGSKQPYSKRIIIINDILRLLGSANRYSEIDFIGCPTPIKIKVNSARSTQQQQEIWNCFRSVAKNERNGLTLRYFNQARKWYGIELSSFTIFLFWINPDIFVPLDSNTLDYLNARQIISSRPDSFNDYSELLNRVEGMSIPEIVAEAYSGKTLTTGVNLQQTTAIFSKNQEDTSVNAGNTDILHDFRIIALELFEDENPELKKVMKKGFYQFYKCFAFEKENKIKYLPGKDLEIYGSHPHVNLSAIVGTNGSGKSTITELIYAGINNLSRKKPRFTKDLNTVNNLFMDLYFKTDSVYKVEFRGKEISLYRYSLSENIYAQPQPVDIKDFSFDNFFYTIGVNYSHYALNSLHMGQWIERLFHKNDGYQTPIVINPFREKGNINVNTEYDLVRQRLLSNLLERVPVQEEGEEEQSDLRLLADGKSAVTLVFKLNKKKFGKHYNYDGWQFLLSEENEQWKKVIEEIYRIFEIPEKTNPVFKGTAFPWPLFIHNYLLRKLVKLVILYKPYQTFLDPKTNSLTEVDELLKAIKKDPSHMTFKFKQAVNFLKYHAEYSEVLKWDGKTYNADVEKLSVIIEQIKIKNIKEEYRTIELVPPSFLDTEIVLTGQQFFRDLSSGEKQRIYTVSSLVYHLINLESVSGRQLTRYRYINVIFDEVELYFHPEMQREFIYYLLSYLKRVELEFSALNFQFITHSPFILSDIPLQNILFLTLDDKKPELEETLGANIHDMLSNSFFLNKGYMGEHTKRKIKSLTHFLKQGNGGDWDEPLARKFINAIGEPLIQDRLNILFELKFNKNIDHQIKELEIQLNRLKSEKNKE